MEESLATSDEWSRVGFTGNPVTGNPGVVENITKELRDLGDLAGRVDGGLDTLLTKAEDGGFEGRTADALRTYVKDELKTFMANINRSFEMAADATARYARALAESQDRAQNAADTVAALERVGGQPLPENDPEMNRARNEVDAEVDAIQAEAKILEETLREAARLVSRPVKKPKKSFWKRFVSTFFKVLEIVALVVTIVAAIIGGPLGLVAFGLGAVLFAKALVDYATGNGNALSLGLAFLGILFPSTKGLTTLGGLARLGSSGGKALGGALSASGRMLFRGGRMLFSSPGRLLSLAGQGLVRFGSGLGSRAAGGFMALPRFLSKTPAMLGSALRFMGGFARNTFRQGRSALTRDFVQSTAFVGGNMAGRLGVFTVMSLGRLTMTALLPMRYSEIARFGYRGAFRMGFIDRGMHFTGRTVGTLGRTGSLALDLTNLTGRNFDEGGLLRPFNGTNTDRLAVPGTPEFNATLDELADISVTPVTTPRVPGFSSLTGSGTPRMPGRLDDMGGRLTTLDTLDTVGLPVGTVPGGQRFGMPNPVTGRVGDDLMPPRPRTALTMFDQVDEFGDPFIPGTPTALLPPRDTLDQLRNLDELTGLERTGAGLLKPLDELSDLAELSLDGRLGGLTEFQVRKILDGEIDLVNVAPDGVVLRVGKTDPVDVRVRFEDGVQVDVLGPADTRVPAWNTTTGGDRLDELGIRLDDLTRLIPDTGDDARTARDLLGLAPVRTDLTAAPLAKGPGFTPLTLRDIVTGGATGKLATERFQAWARTQATQFQLDTAGRRLSEIDGLTDVPPLGRARAELDLSAAKIDFNRARTAFDRLGMNLDTVRRDVTVMMARMDGPGATLPTGELRLLDDLGRPTGQWITMEPGPTVNWVLKGDSGVVPDVRVTMTDGVFTLTPPDGLVTRIGLDGTPLLDDIPVRLESPAGPSAAPRGVDPVRLPVAPEVTAPSVPQVHWLVRQDMDFAATVGKSGSKTRLTEDGLVPVRIDGTITPLQAVSTTNAKVFKEGSQFTAFSVPGGTGKPFGNSEIGLDLVSLSNDITAGAENVRGVRILSNAQLQQEILKEIRFAVGDSTLEIPSKFTHVTKNDEIKKFLAEYNVPKKLGASVTTDIKTLLQVRRDNTWLVQGTIPKDYLTGPYPTVDSLKFVPAAPAATTPTITAPTDLLESAGRASGSGLQPMETPQSVIRTDDFFMSNVDLEQLRGVKLVRQDDFHTLEVDDKSLRKSHFNPDIGMIPANPDGRTTAFQHVVGAEIAERKSNSPFTSFAVSGGEKVYGDTEFALDVYKLGLDIKAGNLENVGILPARDLQRLIGDQIAATIGKRLDFSGLTGASSRPDVIDFLKKNDVNVAGRGGKDAIGKIARDVRALLNTTRDQEWLIKGTIPRSYLEGPYPRATGPESVGGPAPVGDALHGLDEAAGDLRLSDTFKSDFEVKAVSVEWRTPAGVNSGRLLESRVGELPLLDGLGRPTGQWITMEPGPTITWVLKTDSGTVVPDVQVRMADGVFTVTASDGVVTRFGADGLPAGLGDPGRVPLPALPRTSLDEVVPSSPGDLDRLAFAADRSVDIQAIAPAPVWRESDETLWRIGGKRGLDQIFSEGFTVRDPLETNLDVMVRTGQPSAFVSTTTDPNLIWDGVFKFEIEASGGIDVGRTFERSMGPEGWRTSGWASENEIAFPGGIASDFIRGAYRMDAQHNLVEWIPNPHFRGGNPLPELAADIRTSGAGTPGISALDFRGPSVDDQLKLLDQLDLGGAGSWDEIGSLEGTGSLDEVNSVDGFGSLDDAGDELDFGYRSDDFRLDRFDAPAPRSETVLLDPQQVAGVPGVQREWLRTPLDDGGFTLADPIGDTRLVFTADDVLRFRDVRLPGADGFLRFEAAPGPGSLPRPVGTDGLPVPGGAAIERGAVIEPVRGALNVVTGVRVQALDGAWIGRFDLDGTRLSEQLTLSGPVGGPLTGARLTTTFTQLPGGATAPAYRLTVPGLGDGAFSVVRLDGDLAQRLPGGVAVTDTTGARFVFDRGGRFVDLSADGATPTRLDASGAAVPETTVGPVTALDDLGGPLSEQLTAAPGGSVLDDVATGPTGSAPAGEHMSVESLAIPAPPRVAPPPAPAPPRVVPPPVPAAAPPVHMSGAPMAARPARAVAPGFESSFPAPSIGTESELSGFVVALPESADRTFAFVSKVDTDEPLLMVTKDMGSGGYTNPTHLPMAQRGNWQTHTVELITYPSRLGDQVAVGARNDATQWLLDVFKDRLGVHNHQPLESMISPDGLYRLQVTSDRHVIAAGTGLELEGLPSVSMPTTGQQATLGVRAVDFGTRATDELRLLADRAHWYKPAFRNDDALRTALSRETLDAPQQVENAYTYVKSVIDFTSHLVNRHGIPMEGWAGAPPYRGLTHPAVKNEWGVLPRTRPSLVLDSLSSGDRAVTLRLLRETPALGDESIWTAARQYILNGNEVAGRGINNATVGGERALLFEFRTLPDELKGSVPREKVLVSLVSDPLAELGGNRATAVQKINDFVSGPENRDAFADWYRAEFPRDPDAGRIHRNKSTDSILRMAAARHKAEWIAVRHPRTWQDITVRPAAIQPPASAVPSAPPVAPPVAPRVTPPVAPHAAAGPLPDELGRPVTGAGGPDVPVVDLPRITREPGPDLTEPLADPPRITQGPGPDLTEPLADPPRITQGPGPDLFEPLADLPLITRGPVADLSGPAVPRQPLDSPVPPVSSVREVPLSGLDDVTGLRLRITEIPATDAVPASLRIEVVDFTARGGPVLLPDVPVAVREGGGFTATGPRGGVRWQFDALGQLEHRELPLSGTDFALRFTDDALDPMPVVGRGGVPVSGASVTAVRNATGALSELTVRVPMPGTDGLPAVWRFEPGGLLRQQEQPITLPGLDGSSGLGIKVTVTPGAGGTTTRVVELTGPQHLTGALRLTSVDSTLSGRLPNGFTVTDTLTHSRFHLDADRRLVLRDLPDRDGSGFLRFTEDSAPGTAPVRLADLGGLPPGIALDDVARIAGRTLDEAGSVPRPPDELGRLTGPEAPRISSLPEFHDLGPQERALVDDLWARLVQDVRPVSPDELNRVVAPDTPRTDSLSAPGALPDPALPDPALPDPDLAALRARLDNLRRMDGEPRPAPAAPAPRAGGLADLTRLGPDGRPLSPDELTVPLSGVDDLADFDLRATRLPVTDATPPGSYRLELVDRTPGGAGPVRASDFTVELLDDSGRFAVIDPAGTTRFTLDPQGGFLGRETALAFDGLPEGLRLNVTVSPGARGARRVTVDLLVPAGATHSVRLTPATGTLAERLPGGFTLADTVTGSRFHFDHTGRPAFRDVPDRDGSGFLRFTEGAAPGTPPIRLDDLGDLGDGIDDVAGASARVPLTSENGVLDGVDMARIFDVTLDEASGFRRPPEGASANMSDIARALDFLEAAPDPHGLHSLDLPGVQRLADEATASLDRLGLRPELLNDELRQMTGQARQTLRQHAVTTLGDYLDLPLATRLDDLRSVSQGAGGRVIGDFTVTPTPHGGPGGSRYTVRHDPSDVTLGFGPNRELLYQEVFLRGGPDDLDGLKAGITGRSADGGPWIARSLDFVGARPADGLFTTAPNPRGGFTVTDAASTTSWHYGPEGVHSLRDVQLPGGRGILRFDADAPGGVPRVLDSADRPFPGVRPELLDDGGIALIPTGKAARPMERTVFSPTGTLREETIAVRIKGGRANGEHWRIDHATGTAVRVDSSGTALTGRFSTAKVEMSGTGRFKLTGEGGVTLFEREVLGNGNVLHIDVDRVGRARWTEFDPAGTKVRAGERIWDGDRRTVHDTLSYRWAPMDVLDVRTYTKAVDGGLIRAEKGAAGDWTWTRFDSGGTEVLSGTREWSWNHIGFKDTYIDPVTGQRTVAQQRGNIWPLNGYHGSRQYLEHPVLPGQSPAGLRVNPELHTGVGPANKPIDVIEHLADGGTLHVVRVSDQRMPAALWQTRAGVGRFDGFFGNSVTGDSMFAVSKWTETAADGTRLKGVRLVSHGGHSWRDVDQFGRIVRETRKLENGDVVEVGRGLDDPTRWAPAPKWNGSAAPYELPWLDTTSGVSGTRHVAGDGSFEDVFTNAAGDELLAMRSQGTGVREYLGENPARGIGRDDVSGVWVDKNTQLQITGRRDLWGDLRVEAHGNPRHRTWEWKATGPDGTVTEGVRLQNRGSLYSRTWDDSFVDFERLENGRPGRALRERDATDDGTVWIDATRQPDHTWTWRKTNADGTVHSQGVREYQDVAKGRWTDRIGDDVVRRRTGGRVREYAYTVEETAPAARTPSALTPPETGPTTLADLLSRSARHFEPTTTVTVDREVWREFDMGKVLHRRDAVEGVPGRYRESESLWGQWREYQGDRLVAQRTITGRVWATDAFGRWSAFDVAKLPEISSLPTVGGQVGLDGHRAWRLIGREVDFRGYTTEFRGLNREFRDPFHEIWTGVRDGSSAAMPLWRHELRKAATEFATGFLIEFGTSFAVSAIVSDFANTRFDPLVAFERALLNGAVGGVIRSGFNVAQDMTALGKIKQGLANLDQGQDWNRHSLASSDDWAGEWASYENPVRWRSGTYAFFDGLTVSALTGFVNNAANAAIWGVGGQKHTGVEALEAGAWGAAGSLFTGVTSGMARYTFHTTAGSRIFHRGGPGELIWQSAESLTTGILNYWINTRGAHIDSTHPFPPSTTTPTTPPTTTPTTPSQGTR
ncbi:actin cross-linking domain-containing toxin [Streptomyces sp. NBC_00104]|uniref:actin cross-linking domain-containing toxin n=1 Tax=Streptomyces sp. NBC_00104 TaxID=2903621 RepID=UPI00324F94AC